MLHPAVILILIDGLGIGEFSPHNPLTSFSPQILRFYRGQLGPLPRAGKIWETQVDGGVAGRPQSASNHTSLLTGINAPRLLGRHLTGYPNACLRSSLARQSIFRQVLDQGLWPTFANCFSPAFFRERPRWVSASTVMCESAGIRLRTLQDLMECRGLYMDITHEILATKEPGIAPRTPGEAARNLIQLSSQHNLTFFEYFLTDLAGHKGDLAQAKHILTTLDEFLAQLVDQLPDHVSLLVTSDHGNLENLEQRQHTENPVATLVWGALADSLLDNPLQLTDITPAIVRFLDAGST